MAASVQQQPPAGMWQGILLPHELEYLHSCSHRPTVVGQAISDAVNALDTHAFKVASPLHIRRDYTFHSRNLHSSPTASHVGGSGPFGTQVCERAHYVMTILENSKPCVAARCQPDLKLAGSNQTLWQR